MSVDRTRPAVVVTGLRFPEGPRWRDGSLWFSDIHGHTVHRFVPGDGCHVVARLPDRPSGLGFLPDGTPLVVSELDRAVLRIGPDGQLSLHADLRGHGGDFCNDMVVDGQGRAWVGNRIDGGYNPDSLDVAPAAGREHLLLVRPDGTVALAADGLISPNGCVVTPDGDTLIVAETRAHRLTAFSIAPDGRLGDRRVFATTGKHFPDGICLDAQGAVWLGSPITRTFLRVAEGGAVLDTIQLEQDWAVAPALGGADRRDLYMMMVTTTLANLTALGHDRNLDAGSSAVGSVGVLRVPTPGAGWP